MKRWKMKQPRAQHAADDRDHIRFSESRMFSQGGYKRIVNHTP